MFASAVSFVVVLWAADSCLLACLVSVGLDSSISITRCAAVGLHMSRSSLDVGVKIRFPVLFRKLRAAKGVRAPHAWQMLQGQGVAAHACCSGLRIGLVVFASVRGDGGLAWLDRDMLCKLPDC